MKNFSILSKIVFVTIFTTSTCVFASGYSDPVTIGPRAIGMGGAFAGIADDPSAVYHNPAAITRLKGQQIEVGMDANLVNFDFTPTGGTKESSNSPFTPAPFFFYTNNVMENLSLGLGVYFPHGNVVEYPTASANVLNPTEVSIYSMEITPTVSINLPGINGLSFGMGFRVVRLNSSLKGQGFVLSQAPLIIDTLETLDVSGWTTGAVFSTMYQPMEEFSIGLVYRSPLEADLTGTGKFTGMGEFNATVTQIIPGMFTAGLGIFPSKKVKVGLSYDYEQNSQNSQQAVNFSVFPGGVAFPLNWKDSHTLHLGVSYDWTDAFYSSLGYARDLNQTIQDSSSDRGNTDFNAHFICAGVGGHIGKFDLNAAYKAFFGSNDVYSSNPVPGKYEILTHTISTSVAYKF